MKVVKYYILFMICVVIFLSSTAIFIKENRSNAGQESTFSKEKVYDNSKLIKFDHKIHVTDLAIKCQDCHTNALTSVSSKNNLNPKKKDCSTCHDVKDEKTCNLCHYDGVLKKLRSSDHELIFSHKQHAKDRQCVDCHQGFDKVKFSKESASAFPSMESCYTCHNNEKASTSNNCESCHTNLTNLIPQNHLKSNFLNEHKSLSVSGVSSKNDCMMCHSDNFCQVCHSPSKFNGNNSQNNFNVPYYTKEGATRIDRGDLQKLTTVHNLNYKFLHGLDANQKSFECKTCHEPANFCASCHQNGGDLITGIAPKSHQQPNFTTLGVNSGGGLHSELARKDIESCQSCHDVEGRDPTCIKCHFDSDGVKGTNPKTHESGFLSDDKGIWHDTQGAVCYTCHTDANAKPNGVSGVGFCGYCHGR